MYVQNNLFYLSKFCECLVMLSRRRAMQRMKWSIPIKSPDRLAIIIMNFPCLHDI